MQCARLAQTVTAIDLFNSKKQDGAPARDVLRRRVRVAEYYRIPWEPGIEQKYFSFYDESKVLDSLFLSLSGPAQKTNA